MIIPTLQGEQRVALARPHLLRKIFSFTPTPADEVIKALRDETEQNELLSVISACCTLGLFFYNDGCWRPTRLGYMIAMLGPLADPVEMVRNFPFTVGEIINANLWAKEVILDERNRAMLEKFFTECMGWNPNQLEMLGERESALLMCAALVTHRMAWFTGWRFEPTLYGLWFTVHPDSPLNKR